MAKMDYFGTLKERLERRLIWQPSGCLEWTGYRSKDGYGRIGDGHGKMPRTHRAAWTVGVGPIPEGQHVLHHCDNPPCCNVAHVFLGTNADNVADKVAKGRQYGKKKPRCLRGHPFDDVNTYIDPGGRRGCRACRSAAMKLYYQRKRSA